MAYNHVTAGRGQPTASPTGQHNGSKGRRCRLRNSKLPSVFAYGGVPRDPDAFADAPTDQVCAAMAAELGMRVHRADRPLHRTGCVLPPRSKPRPSYTSDCSLRAAPAFRAKPMLTTSSAMSPRYSSVSGS